MSEARAQTIVWQGWPHAPAPLGAILAARRLGPTRVVDEAGRERPFGAVTWLREAARALWQRVLAIDLKFTMAMFARRPAPTSAERLHSGDGPVVLVLPVLPDLSHTFVYREVLAMLAARPDWHVVVLQRNDLAPRHPEAEQLLARAEFLPRRGVTASWWLWTRSMWTDARARRLAGLYRAQPDLASRALFDKLALRDPRHPGNAFALAAMLRRRRPRHLHVYASTWPANVAMGAAQLLDVPFSISSYVDFEFPYSHRMLAEKVARATFFRVVTRYCRERLRALLPETPAARVPVVYLGIDLDDWQQRATPSGDGEIVSAARLVPKKGLHLLPEALAALRRRGVSFRWRVLGDGPERARLEQLCERHGVADLVEFRGAVASDAVRAALLSADLAVLPCVIAHDGERDGIPIFFVEAMALGVPVVTTPISGIPELVRDGDTGFLCAPDDPTALADRLGEALGDPRRARDVGERGRDEVRRKLDVHVAAHELIAAIERGPEGMA
ncbi:MAG: glycosyltransferase family 4 protein [Planctomycetes bacterium]|nr:glycosyltransferase family 4 protein [Planctomycetota bacterium]